MTEIYYKVLGPGATAHHGGSGSWPKPQGKRPGKYLKVEGEIVPCENGLHLCRREDLVHWLGPEIYMAEIAGPIAVDEHKVVTNKARLVKRLDTWNEVTARLFAADCAEYVASEAPVLFKTIEVVRRYARGQATEEERYAAESAAWSAAESATRYAAESAAWSATESVARYAAESAARYAAWSVAESAARYAARYAAESAAESAAREWQTERLFDYLEGRLS